MDDAPIHEIYGFQCRRCGSSWEDRYEIRTAPNSVGLLQAAYYLDGVRAASPLTQGSCVYCDSSLIRVVSHVRTAPAPSPSSG